MNRVFTLIKACLWSILGVFEDLCVLLSSLAKTIVGDTLTNLNDNNNLDCSDYIVDETSHTVETKD